MIYRFLPNTIAASALVAACGAFSAASVVPLHTADAAESKATLQIDDRDSGKSPRDTVLIRKKKQRTPTVAGRAGWRVLDPITAEASGFVSAGDLPLEGAVFPVGRVRVVVDVANGWAA